MDIGKEIDKQLLSDNDRRERSVGEYYCTDLGTCIRKTFYKYNCTEELPKESEEEIARTLRIFERGNYLHGWVSERLRVAMDEIGGSMREEVSLVIPDMLHQFTIRGRIDNLLVYPDETYEVVEVKTIARIPSPPPRGRKVMPQPHHVAQTLPYLLFSPNRTKGSILYLEPASFKTAQYDIPYDRFAMEDLWKRGRRIHECVTTDILPEAEAKANKVEEWQCKYCEYANICERHGDDTKQPTQTLPPDPMEDDTLTMEEMIEEITKEDENLEQRLEEGGIVEEALEFEAQKVDEDLEHISQKLEEGGVVEEALDDSIEESGDAWARAKARMDEAEAEQNREAN